MPDFKMLFKNPLVRKRTMKEDQVGTNKVANDSNKDTLHFEN